VAGSPSCDLLRYLDGILECPLPSKSFYPSRWWRAHKDESLHARCGKSAKQALATDKPWMSHSALAASTARALADFACGSAQRMRSKPRNIDTSYYGAHQSLSWGPKYSTTRFPYFLQGFCLAPTSRPCVTHLEILPWCSGLADQVWVIAETTET